jgi:hypothetical protein
VIYTVVRPNFHLPAASEQLLQFPAGLLNGFLTGLTGSQILPLLPYMMSLKLDPSRFVQAINIAVITASLILILALMVSGLMTWPARRCSASAGRARTISATVCARASLAAVSPGGAGHTAGHRLFVRCRYQLGFLVTGRLSGSRGVPAVDRGHPADQPPRVRIAACQTQRAISA